MPTSPAGPVKMGTQVTDRDDVLKQIYEGAAAGSCKGTARGFVWDGDLHDTHGNADSRQEAEYVAAAHANYFEEIDPLDDPCDLYIEQIGQPLD